MNIKALFLCLALMAPPMRAAVLQWDANPGQDIQGYKLYEGPATGTYTNAIDTGAAHTAAVNVAPGETRYFTVTAYNSLGLESDFSAELKYNAPVPFQLTVFSAPAVAGPWTPVASFVITNSAPEQFYKLGLQ